MKIKNNMKIKNFFINVPLSAIYFCSNSSPTLLLQEKGDKEKQEDSFSFTTSPTSLSLKRGNEGELENISVFTHSVWDMGMRLS